MTLFPKEDTPEMKKLRREFKEREKYLMEQIRILYKKINDPNELTPKELREVMMKDYGDC